MNEEFPVSEFRLLIHDPTPATRLSILQHVMAKTQPSPPFSPRWLWHQLPAVSLTTTLLAVSTFGLFALTAQALPPSPTYQMRLASESLRLVIASPQDREYLRLSFANDRFSQAQQIASFDQEDALYLLHDGQRYLTSTHNDLSLLSLAERERLQSQITHSEQLEAETESNLAQAGQH